MRQFTLREMLLFVGGSALGMGIVAFLLANPLLVPARVRLALWLLSGAIVGASLSRP